MKKLLFTLAFGLLSIAGFSHSEIRVSPYDSSVKKLGIKSVNTKAMNDFKSRFGHVANESWFVAAGGTACYFTVDSFLNRIYYNKKGRWQYSLLCYGEAKLDRGVRKAVKMNFYDEDIKVVREIQTPSGLVYVINLEDKSWIKILKINREGEMEIMEELKKQ